MKEQTVDVDYEDITDSLVGQVSDLSRKLAINVAIIKSKDKTIAELRKENEQLRKEQIKEMDEGAE